MKKLALAIAAFLFAIALAPCGAFAGSSLNANVTFNASTSSTLTITGVSNYCVGFTCTGLGLQGFATGTDSLGNSYTLGSFGDFYTALGAPDPWYSTPGCAGFSNCRWNSNLSFTDPSIGGFNPGDNVTLFQAPNGSITLTVLICAAVASNVCTASTNLIFDLQVDPAMLANLQAGQSVALTVTGGCVTTGTSCGTTGSTTPEPGTLLLLGSGLLGFAPFIRRKFTRS
jgi:hypothetical protein